MKKAFYYFLYIGVMACAVFTLTNCDNDLHNADVTTPTIAYSLPPCDTLENVVWGDTLRVVNKTISTGSVRNGPFKGKTYWQAMLYSNNLIAPTRFQNDGIKHRVVIADTTEITYSSIFIIARVK